VAAGVAVAGAVAAGVAVAGAVAAGVAVAGAVAAGVAVAGAVAAGVAVAGAVAVGVAVTAGAEEAAGRPTPAAGSPTGTTGAAAGADGRRVWTSDAGRLVTRRPERLTGAGLAVSPGRGGAPPLPASAASDEITSTEDGWRPSGSGPPTVSAAFFAAAFLAGFAGSGSSGWTSLRRPSRSALRRARSA